MTPAELDEIARFYAEHNYARLDDFTLLLAAARQNLRRGELLERIDLATCYGKIPKELIEDIAKELP